MVGVSLDDLQVEFEGFSIKIDDQVCGRLNRFRWLETNYSYSIDMS